MNIAIKHRPHRRRHIHARQRAEDAYSFSAPVPRQSPSRPARSPGRYIAPIYGQKSPQLTSVDESPRLLAASVTELQAIIGTLLHCARAVGPSLLPIANEFASKQEQLTTAVMNAASRALSYCAGKPNMATTFYACGMILPCTWMPPACHDRTPAPSSAASSSWATSISTRASMELYLQFQPSSHAS
jgi:hypothetical protein